VTGAPEPTTTGPPGPDGHDTTVRPAWRRAAVATLAVWATTLLLAMVATPIVASGPATPVAPAPGFAGLEPPPVDAAGGELLGTALVRQDALWYLAIAADGYPTGGAVPAAAAFFPAFPAVVAGVGAVLGGRLLVAAQLVALLACAAALAGVHELARDLLGSRTARWAVVATAVFPTSFFLVAPYPEGMFLAASTWALVQLARGRPWHAAALAAVATLTRPVGVLLAVPLVLGVVGADTAGRRPPLRDRAVAVAGIGAGGVAILLHGHLSWGRPLAVLEAQSGWQRELVPFVVALYDGARIGLGTLVDGSAPYHLLDLLVLLVTVTAIVVMARRRQLPLVVHGVVSLLLWTSLVFGGRPLMSTPRFALGVPAVLLGVGLLLDDERHRPWLLPVLGALFAVHAVLFTRWLFVF
jgi:hypothetical protein